MGKLGGRALLGQGPCYSVCRRNSGAAHSDAAAVLRPREYWWEILISLALFRFFDIFKPLGIRSLEKLPGGYGMMADDVLAAIYSCVILLVLNHFIL